MNEDVRTEKAHDKQIMDLQTNKDLTFIVSSSKDNTAKVIKLVKFSQEEKFYSQLFDIETLDHLKTYTTDRPVNSASISPLKDHIVLGGGQEAMEVNMISFDFRDMFFMKNQVTQTASQTGKFEARFFHLIFEEEFARVKGHFGPINTLAYHPDGKRFVLLISQRKIII